MIKVGRYTASALLIVIGVLLLVDQTSHTRYLALFYTWWPVVLISLGCEFLLFNLLYRRGERQLRLDWSGLFLSVLISALVVGATQAASLPVKWLSNLKFNIDWSGLSYSGESGYKFEKGITKVPLAAGTDKILFDNPNGSVELKPGAVQDIEIGVTVWVDKIEKDQAESVAERSVIEYAPGSTLRITAKGNEYSGNFSAKRKPRMNLVVTVPADRRADYELQLKNGKVDATQIPLKKEMNIRTTNGTITLSGLDGDLHAETTNGAIDAAGIRGKVSLSTTNGTVSAKNIGGDAKIDTTNGAVTIEQAGGTVDVDTTNGKITIFEAAKDVKADTTNGAVSVASHTVGGNWELKTVNSLIEVKLPPSADAEIKAAAANGTITTDLPLTVEKKKLTGKLGSGKYQIKLDTNGSVDVNKID